MANNITRGAIRLERYIANIASLDQWLVTIAYDGQCKNIDPDSLAKNIASLTMVNSKKIKTIKTNQKL